MEIKGKLRRKKVRIPDPDLQLACLIAYRLGWRMQSEILMLERRHVDMERSTLSLDPGSTKNDDGAHGVSIGFTSHYALMRERFGNRVTPGCAGENVLVETAGRITLDALAGGVAFVAGDGREVARLDVQQVAHPCRPFSGWALGGTVETDVLKETLQFLDEGTRGFYCTGIGSGVISVGDRAVLLEPLSSA